MASPRQAVALASGLVKGKLEGNIEVFKGIPYTEPPVGAWRWRPPQPVKEWDGVRSAFDFGPACMQTDMPFTPPLNGMSEDCLTVNVWRPIDRGDDKLPVMVWIPGGGFVNGTACSSLYDGTPFAKAGVVLVSVNYRFGRFGFFAHPALTREHPGEPLGNYAFMDQIAALRWVKRNIAAFGGNPDNVTIFGESAGARSILAMLIAPDASGLFHKAIVESTTHGMMSNEWPVLGGQGTATSGESIGEAFAASAQLGNADAAGLRGLSAEAVVGGLSQNALQPTTFAGPMIDGVIMTDTFSRAFEKKAFTPVPLIIGTTDYEARAFIDAIDYDGFLKKLGSNREPLMKAYEKLYPDADERKSRVMTEALFYEPTRAIARSFVREGQPTYVYRYSYRAQALRAKTQGALHASELPFVFDNLAQTPATSMGPTWTQSLFSEPLSFTDDDRAMAKLTKAYWINFAKTGDPNATGLPTWTAFSTTPNAIMSFGETGAGTESDPAAARLDMIEPVNAVLRR